MRVHHINVYVYIYIADIFANKIILNKNKLIMKFFTPTFILISSTMASCLPKYPTGVARTSRALLSALPGSAQLRQM